MRRCLFASLVIVSFAAPVLAQEPHEEFTAEDANLAALEDLMAKIQARVDALDEASTARDDSLKFLNQQIEQAIGSMSGQQDHNTSLQEKNADLHWEIEGLLESREELNEKLKLTTEKFHASTNDMQAQIAALSELLSFEENAKIELMKENNYLLSKLKAANSDREALDQALGEARYARATDQDALQAQEKELSRLNDELSALQEEISTVSKALAISQEQVAQKETDISDLHRQLKLLRKSDPVELSRFRTKFLTRLNDAIGIQPDVRVKKDRVVFQSELLFESRSAKIAETGRMQLSQLARALIDVSLEAPQNLDWVLRVDSHTDRQAISALEYSSNWELSTKRAITVVQALVHYGIPPGRLAATGFGEFQPIDPADDEIAYRRNRRVEFKITQE